MGSPYRMVSFLLASLLLAAQAPASPDTPPDVVVMAHSLRRLRLRYAADGRSIRWCRAEVSTGDRKLDEMGCKVLGWCVRRGFDEPDRALACLHWFQARLDDRARAEEDRRLAAGNTARPPQQP